MQKTAYEMRISDWSSDVCSSDLAIHWKRRTLILIEDFSVRQHARIIDKGNIIGGRAIALSLFQHLVLQAALRRDDARFIRVGGHEACRRLPDDAFRSCISKASPRQGRYGYTHPQSGQRALGNRTKGYSGYFRHAGMPLCRRKCEMRKACLTERRRVPPAYAPACVRDGQRRPFPARAFPTAFHSGGATSFRDTPLRAAASS